MRLLLGLYAHSTGSTAAHRTACYLNHAGVYIRIGITIFKPLIKSYSLMYTTVVFVSGAICFESGSHESGFLPPGVFTVLLGLAAVVIKCLRDFNVNLELESPLPVSPPQSASTNTIESESAKSQLATNSTPLTLSALRDLDASLSPHSATNCTFSSRDTDNEPPQDPAMSDGSSSRDETPLPTPQSESAPLVPFMDLDGLSSEQSDEPWTVLRKAKMALAPINTSVPDRTRLGPFTAGVSPWTALLSSPIAKLPLSAQPDAASIRRELKILAARAGLSPLKEWQAVRRWDRERLEAATRAAPLASGST